MLVNANGTITTNGIPHSGYHNAAGVTMLQQQQQHHQQQTVDSYGNAWIPNNNNSMLSQQQQQQLQQRQEQQQQQYQNMQMQMIYRAHQHQQQPTTNASMNGYPPCTSASPGGGVAPSAVAKHAALKRKSAPNGTDVDAAKKPAFSAVQFVQRPQTAIYQQQPYVMQQTPQQSPNLPLAVTPPHLSGQLKYAAQYAGYESPNHKYMNNNNMNNSLAQQQQQQQAGARPNSRSEMVRHELRNSVHACQSATGTSPPNLPQPQQQQQALLSNGQYISTAQHHHHQQQSQQQPTNFIASNLNNNNNNNNNAMVSYEDKLMPQQFYADTLSLLADQQVPCGLDDGFLDISATVDLFELFGCDYDTDSADTQRLIDKLLG